MISSRKERELRIAYHPDRHDGDHTLMERVYAAMKRPSQSMKNKKYCRWCQPPVRISGLAESCRMHWRKVGALTCLMLAIAAPAQPFFTLPKLPTPHATVPATYSVKLLWDAPTGPAPVAGYLIYAGATTNSMTFATNAIGTSITVTNFTLPQYFAVTAINSEGESKLSNIVGLLAQDLRLEVIGEHSDSVTGNWLEYPTQVFIGTNVTGHEFTRLKVRTTPIYRVVNLP